MRLLSIVLSVVLVPALYAQGGDVRIPDQNLLLAVSEAYSLCTGRPLSDPPQDTELADPLFATLDASQRGISDITGLSYCTSLMSLALSENQIACAREVENLVALEELLLDKNQLTFIPDLSKLCNLSTLGLECNPITDWSPVTTKTTLTILRIGGPHLRAIPDLTSLTDLAALRVANSPLSDASAVSAMEELLFIEILNCGLTEAPDLSKIKWLDYVDFGGNRLSALPDLSGLTCLTSLMAEKNLLSDVSGMLESSSIVWAHLNDNLLREVPDVSRMSSLYLLELCRNKIVSLPAFDGPASLAVLSVEENLISSVGNLSRLPGLRAIALNGNQVADLSWAADMRRLLALLMNDNRVEAIPNLSGMEWLIMLHLGGNAIRDVRNIGTAGDLKELYLQANAIEDIGPLADKADLGGGDIIRIEGNPLSQVSVCTFLPVIEARMTTGRIDSDAVCGKMRLALKLTGKGTVSPEPGVQWIDPEVTTSLSASMEPGSAHYFDGWYGEDGSLLTHDVTLSVHMDSYKAMEARFVTGPDIAILTLDTDPASTGTGTLTGTGLSGAGAYAYAPGSAAHLRAVPAPGMFFGGWFGDVTGFLPEISVEMDRPRTVLARFDREGVLLTIDVASEEGTGSPLGTTSPAPGTYPIAAGACVRLTATAGVEGWSFSRWDNGLEDTAHRDPVLTVAPLNADRTVTAYFEKQ